MQSRRVRLVTYRSGRVNALVGMPPYLLGVL